MEIVGHPEAARPVLLGPAASLIPQTLVQSMTVTSALCHGPPDARLCSLCSRHTETQGYIFHSLNPPSRSQQQSWARTKPGAWGSLGASAGSPGLGPSPAVCGSAQWRQARVRHGMWAGVTGVSWELCHTPEPSSRPAEPSEFFPCSAMYGPHSPSRHVLGQEERNAYCGVSGCFSACVQSAATPRAGQVLALPKAACTGTSSVECMQEWAVLELGAPG